MAGVKGRSGGARPGTGGPQPGSGRPKNSPATLNNDPGTVYDDPQEFLSGVMNDVTADARLRVDAAKALMPYRHTKKGENGKKGERQAAAGKASQGKYAPAAPPRLVVSNVK